MITMIINDSPYGNERPYNALRLATALVKQGARPISPHLSDGRCSRVRCCHGQAQGVLTANGTYGSHIESELVFGGQASGKAPSVSGRLLPQATASEWRCRSRSRS